MNYTNMKKLSNSEISSINIKINKENLMILNKGVQLLLSKNLMDKYENNQLIKLLCLLIKHSNKNIRYPIVKI